MIERPLQTINNDSLQHLEKFIRLNRLIGITQIFRSIMIDQKRQIRRNGLNLEFVKLMEHKLDKTIQQKTIIQKIFWNQLTQLKKKIPIYYDQLEPIVIRTPIFSNEVIQQYGIRNRKFIKLERLKKQNLLTSIQQKQPISDVFHDMDEPDQLMLKLAELRVSQRAMIEELVAQPLDLEQILEDLDHIEEGINRLIQNQRVENIAARHP